MTTKQSRRPDSSHSTLANDAASDAPAREIHVVEREARGSGFGTALFTFALGAAAFYGYTAYHDNQTFSRQTLTTAAPVSSAADAAKLAMMESRVKELRESLETQNRQMKEMTATIQTLTKTHEQQRAEWRQELAKLEASSQENGADSAAVQKVTTQLTQLANDLETLKTEQSKQAGIHSNMAAALQQLDQVETLLQEGQPFDAPLAKLKALTTPTLLDPSMLIALEAFAPQGITPEKELHAHFLDMAAIAVPLGIATSENPSFADKLRARLGHLISIRKVGASQDDRETDEIRVARAQAALEQGEIDESLKHLSRLGEAAALPFAEWKINAIAYRDAWHALGQIRTTLYGLPVTATPAPEAPMPQPPIAEIPAPLPPAPEAAIVPEAKIVPEVATPAEIPSPAQVPDPAANEGE